MSLNPLYFVVGADGLPVLQSIDDVELNDVQFVDTTDPSLKLNVRTSPATNSEINDRILDIEDNFKDV